MHQYAARNLLLAVFIVWPPSCALASPPPARTPDELIRNLASAAKKGDVNDFLASLTDSSRRAAEQSFARRAAQQKSPAYPQRETVARPSDDSVILTPRMSHPGRQYLRTTTDDLQSAFSRLKAVEVLSKQERSDGSVELRLKSAIQTPDGKTVFQEDTLLASQEGGAWKLAGWIPSVSVRSMSQPGAAGTASSGQTIRVHRQPVVEPPH
jgi:hypothetical protein